jgi:hypothetical protein
MSVPKFLKRRITKDESRDAGMAAVLLLLILWFVVKRREFVVAAVALHVVNMALPQIYRPFAVLWLGLSDLLGKVVSNVLMSVVFFAVVTPIGFFRRLLGKDSLKLRQFKTGTHSVMVARSYKFTAQDLERPY